MSAPINDGGPAFPWEDIKDTTGQPSASSGMTLRDWFAGQAITGLTPADGFTPDHQDTAAMIMDLAINAYQIADAMLAAREGRAE